MRELAATLGHSLVFPVDCRYCGERIFLYAAPNGGFAIFDSLGPPWPKHQCIGISQAARGYGVRDPSFSTQFRIPVPESTRFGVPSNGQTIEGVVAGQITEDDVVFDGKNAWRVKTRPTQTRGRYIRGTVRLHRGAVELDVREVLLDLAESPDALPTWLSVSAPLPNKPKPSPPVRLRAEQAPSGDLSSGDAAEIQLASMEVQVRDSTSSELLACVADASDNGHRLIPLCLLIHLATRRDDRLRTSEKARFVEILRPIAEGLQLHPLLTTLLSKLSKGTLSALAPSLREWLEGEAKVGQLRAKLELAQRFEGRVQNLWATEKPFAVFIDRQKPVPLPIVAVVHGLLPATKKLV